MRNDESAERMWHADSLISLLGRMDADRLPIDESLAVGAAQAAAVEEWLAAYADRRASASPENTQRPS